MLGSWYYTNAQSSQPGVCTVLGSFVISVKPDESDEVIGLCDTENSDFVQTSASTKQ